MSATPLEECLRRLRQAICFHDSQHVLNLIVTKEGEYARDICRRCGKITMRYVEG